VEHAFNGLLRPRCKSSPSEVLLDTLDVLHEGLAQDESLRIGMVDDVLDLFRAEAEIEGHSDAPILATAKYASRNSLQLYSSMATLLPFFMFRPAGMASWLMRALNCL